MIILLKKSLKKRRETSCNSSPRLNRQPKSSTNKGLYQLWNQKLSTNIDLNPSEYFSTTPEFKKSLFILGGNNG